MLVTLPATGRVAGVAAGQAPRAGTPRTADGKPNLAGIWKPRGHRTPPDLAALAGGRIPYQPWAAAKQRENFRNRRTEDPLSKCFLPGVPRIMSLDRSFQIFQTPQMIALTFEWANIFRILYTNGSSHPEDYDFFMGDSRGRWEGDTLVVDVRNYNDRTWLDVAGNFHSEAMTLVERYTPVDADTISYAATIEDPKVFSKPWTITILLERQKSLDRLPEYICLADIDEKAGLFEREPATWYPGDGRPAVPVTPEQLRAAEQPKRTPPPPAPNARPIRRMPDGTPDIQGFFSVLLTGSSAASFGLEPHPATLTSKNKVPSAGFVIDPPDGLLPTQPWAHALQQDRLRIERAYDDPAAHCFPTGSPRAMNINDTYFLQTPGYVVILIERMSYRIVRLGGHHPPDNVRLWQGDSIGRWDGDTLIVDTTNFNGKNWLSEPYLTHGGEVATYAQHLIERFTPLDAGSVYYEATIIDPVAYTRPFTIAYTMRQAPSTLLEVACKEDDQDLPHLKAIKDAARAAGKK